MLAHISINTKLSLITLSLILISLVLIGVSVVLYEKHVSYQAHQEELKVLAEIIADRTLAAIVFDDPELANENLRALSARSSISSACLLDESGHLFASYMREPHHDVCVTQSGMNRITVLSTHILLAKSIILNDVRVGELQITSDLDDVKDRLNRIALIVTLIAVGVSLAILLLFRRLVQWVSRPLLELSALVRKITRNKDYSIRASKVSDDEVGVLVDAVNDLLETIQSQSHVLMDANQRLEQTVSERTSALRDAQESLIRKERLATLGQLTGTVSHELRNPLGTIQASVDVLRSQLQDCPVEIDRPLQRIVRNIHRCEVIINELLDYSRSAPPDMLPTQVRPWLAEIIDTYPGYGRISLDCLVDDSAMANMDVERMRRAVLNILDNAMQACNERETHGNAGADCWIKVELSRVDAIIRITIRDSGIGMSESVIEKIFEPLFSTKAFGVGLGLAIVRQILEQHMGGIDIHSEINIGTEVILWFPVYEDIN